jgi:hypothetical protein
MILKGVQNKMSASDTHTWLARMVVRRVLRLEMILCQWLLKVCCALKFGALTEALPKLALEVLGACKKASSKIMHSVGLRIPSDNTLKISKAKDLIKKFVFYANLWYDSVQNLKSSHNPSKD